MEINSILPRKPKYPQIIDTIAMVPERLYFIDNLPKNAGQQCTHRLAQSLTINPTDTNSNFDFTNPNNLRTITHCV